MKKHPSFRPTCFDNHEQVKALCEGEVAFFEQIELAYNPRYGTYVAEPEFIEKEFLYIAQFTPHSSLGKLPVAIIPIRDMLHLLEYTLQNLSTNKVQQFVDVIVVDDQSTAENSEKMKQLCQEHAVSYLHVNNGGPYNFSMLNNIAAAIAKYHGASRVILWNADLWTPNSETVPELLRRFEENKAKIAGTKLLFPPFEWPGAVSVPEQKSSVEALGKLASPLDTAKLLARYRGTVQFGGGVWSTSKKNQLYAQHFGLFQPPKDPRVNLDTVTTLLTGAFIILDLDWLIQIDGLNPSLGHLFQDVDLSLKAMLLGEPLHYFGKDIHLYHETSPCLASYTGQNLYSRNFAQHLFHSIWQEPIKERLVCGNGSLKLIS